MREHADGDFPFANDFNAVVRALDGESVVSGCSVDDGGTNDMTVEVTSGTVWINGAQYSVDAQSVTLDSADPDHDRYDVLVVGTDGAVDVVTGMPSTTPKTPSIPSKHVLVSIVKVVASAAGVTNEDILDARTRFSLPKTLDEHANDPAAHHAPPSAGEKALRYADIGR